MKIGLISLGCSKNLVDSEMILGLVASHGATIVNNPSEADMIIINTCGFIEPAKKEAIDTIFEYLDYKETGAKIVVTGCFATRYLEELKKEIPEVDLWVTLKDYDKFGEFISKTYGENLCGGLSHHNRVLTTKSHYAYVRISDGCDNVCHYCAIPLIRGRFISREIEDILIEVKYLVGKGIKEIVLISQDTTRYGTDLSNPTTISELLRQINGIEGVKHIRFLYAYPEEVSDELIETVASLDKVMPYFDLPVQHGNNKVLKSMNRRDTKEGMLELFSKIRTSMPHAVIRTTIIVGYPGETEEEFLDLIDFVKEVKFDRLGAFTFSPEEDTVAATLEDQIDEDVKQARFEMLMKVQETIAYEQNRRFLGDITEVVVEEYDEVEDIYVARNYAYAPDDIDGYIYVKGENLELSSYYKVKITDTDLYNLYAEVVE